MSRSARAAGRRSTLRLVDLDHLEEGVGRLRGGSERAILEVSPINLLLQGEAEQEQVWRRYRQLLSALAGPVSIYSSSRPLVPSDGPQMEPGSDRQQLIAADQQFQQGLVRRLVIQDQQHLLVVWGAGPRPIAELAGALSLVPGARRRGRSPSGRVDLDQRVETLQAALHRIGLQASPLGDGPWLALLQRCGGGRSGLLPQTFASWIAPPRAEIASRHIRVGDQLCRSLSVTSYPRRVGIGWLAPLLRGSGCELRLAQHIVPLPKLATLSSLRRKIRSFETSLVVDSLRGRRGDLGTQAALGDALTLEEQVLLEEERLFQLELCLTLVAESEQSLDQGWSLLLATLAEVGCGGAPLTHRQADGWRATLPLGSAPVGWGREMTASALAAAFPFVKSSLSAPAGVLLGPSLISRELVLLDPFDRANANFNLVVLGTSGAGKSYTAKLLASRLLLGGCQLRCIDPVGEYAGLARLFEGDFRELGPAGSPGLNPLGPPGPPPPSDRQGREEWAAELAARAQPVAELLAAGRGRDFRLDEADSYSLERALAQLFLESDGESAGLEQLVELLLRSGQVELAERLSRYTQPLLRELFRGDRPWDRGEAAVVFSLARLGRDQDQLLPTVMQMILAHLEGEIAADPSIRRLVLVDEAELLLSRPRSAEALESLSRRIRKWGAGLLVVSQVVEDFLDSPVGNVIIRNCHTKLLLRQEEVAIPKVRDAFGLSPAECDLLRDAPAGAGLVIVGRERAAFQGAAPPQLHQELVTDARPGV